MTGGLPGFTVDIDQNPYLPVGGRDVSAIVTVTADDTGEVPAATAAGPSSAASRTSGRCASVLSAATARSPT